MAALRSELVRRILSSGLKRREIAKRSSVSQNKLKQIVLGERVPSLSEACRILAALGYQLKLYTSQNDSVDFPAPCML